MENNEISFKSIWQKIKKAGVRIVIYSIIAVVVLTAVLGVVSITTKSSSYEARIMFNNEYANEGMSPWNTKFEPSGEIKSTYVVNQALENIGLSEEQRIKLLPKVIAGLSVTADFDATSDESKTLNSFSYTVTLASNKDLGLSKVKMQELLDNVCDVFIKNYKSKYSYDNFAQSVSVETVKKYNFIQAIDTLESNMLGAINVAESLAKVNPTFRATESKMNFSDIVAELNANKTKLVALKAYLTETGVQSSQTATSSEVAYLKQIENEMQSAIDSLTSMITSATTSLDKLANGLGNIKVSQDGTLVYDDSNYFAIVKQLLELEQKKADASLRLSAVQEIKLAYGPTSVFSTASNEQKATMIANAENMVANIASELDSTNKKLNDAIAEYNDVENLKNAVVKLQSAKAMSIEGLGVKTIVIADVAAVIVAFVIALIVTDVKSKKKATANPTEVVDKAE